MGFLNEIGQKISSASQEAIAKTKDFADVAKLNSNINDEERKITNAFTEIGKAYFAAHQDDYDASYEAFFTTIKDSQVKIAGLQDQIIAIKGIAKCPGCGAEVPKESAFCPSCGTAMPKDEPAAAAPTAEGKKCPNCGATLAPGAVFCANCGTKMEE